MHQQSAYDAPVAKRSATTVTATMALLPAMTAAWWLVRGDAWLQVAALSLPLVVLLVWLTGRALETASPALDDTRLAGLLRICVTAVAGALGVASAQAVLDLLARPAETGPSLSGSSLSVSSLSGPSLSGIAGDTFVTLPVALVAAALAAIALGARLPARRSLRRRLRAAGLGVAAAGLLFGTAGLMPGAYSSSVEVAPVAAGPCPAGAPTKTFDVQAINVDMPLNRFGDHDPKGRMYVLSSRISDVRAEEASQQVSIGLRDDAIQPLVIRANEGDCVNINYKNNADGAAFGLHVDGLPFSAGSAEVVGNNPVSNPAKGESRSYTYWIPVDDTLEGAHYLHPGPGFRAFVNHGLFGSLVVEPPGSTYLDPNASDEAHAAALESGWEAIVRPAGNKEFRENVQLYHEIGNESETRAVLRKNGKALPLVDPHTDAYRPGTRAMNYRSEPFFDRLERAPQQEAHAYGSYTFGDPATPMPRGYQADPTKFRILHAGSEMFHVFHMHGGGIRWRFNPVADSTFDYAYTGLNKHPIEETDSERLDSQSFGPGESYNLEIEGGAGGVQQGAGDFLFHCHIAEHYVAGMWSFWRVYDTRQPEFAPLADRAAPPVPVESQALVGTDVGTGDHKTHITAANLGDWIRPQLPPKGVTFDNLDPTVWNWTTNPANPLQYLGEPEAVQSYPDYYNDPAKAGHPTALPVDRFEGNRPVILFNPVNGRPAFPLLRPHLGKRPPFAPGGHSGAPYLGENGGTPAPATGVDPYAERDDGICPAKQADGSPTQLRRFNVVAIERSVKTSPQDTDPVGMVYALAHDKDAILRGDKPVEPLAIRANLGDCVAVTLTSELSDTNAAGHFSMVNMHIHHVQFDTQASDGVISGMSYEQAVRPYKLEDPQLTSAAAAGDVVLHLASVAKFHLGAAIGVGLGTEGPDTQPGETVNPASGRGPEIRTITAIDTAAKTVTLDRPLDIGHPQGQWAGTEFTQYRWFPDVDLDNIFWHDHVDGIHTWAHGLVGQLVTEPKGSTYHDPRTGAEVDSGAIVDIHTTHPLAEAAGVSGSFRELALWTLDKGFGKDDDSYLNLRAAPLKYRGRSPTAPGDPSLSFSSYKWGDPDTPLPRAYPGDPFVIRTINVGPSVDTLHVDGHDFLIENRYTDANHLVGGGSTNTIHYGISEKFTLILRGGAGGTNKLPGDYLYFNGIERRLNDGAWGIIRVLPGVVPGAGPSDPNFLRPLPGTTVGTGTAIPAVPPGPDGRPPAAPSGVSPCPATAPVHNFDLTAIKRKTGPNALRFAYVPTAQVGKPGVGQAPLTMHLVTGECVTVKVKNSTGEPRIGFHLTGLAAQTPSSGVDVGYNGDTTIANGATRSYTYFVDNPRFTGGAIGDLTGSQLSKRGLYGVYTVAPAGSTFTDPVTGRPADLGEAVDVAVPGGTAYRDFSLIMSDDERLLGGSFMPYKANAENPTSALVNYRRAPRNDILADAFRSPVFGDPATPLLRSYAGDKVVVTVLVAPGSEQIHSFNLGGLTFPTDARIPGSNSVQTKGVGPWEVLTATLFGDPNEVPDDYFYGDLRRPFTQAGMWGLQRVEPAPTSCPTAGVGALLCLPAPG